MSAIGPSADISVCSDMSAFGGKADINVGVVCVGAGKVRAAAKITFPLQRHHFALTLSLSD